MIRANRLLLAASLLAATCGPAAAQFVLPGAVAPAPAGTVSAPPAARVARPPAAAQGAAVFAPAVDGLLDRSLLHNGTEGRLEFSRRDKALAVERLSLAGQKISIPGQMCRVDLAPADVSLKEAGRPNGALRYEMTAGSCTLSFDVLDGAVNVAATAGTCEFQAQDCRATPAGLWGPPGASLNAAWVKTLEKSRGDADKALRANFRALLERTKDREQVKLIAREQAGFSSERTTICRDYLDEAKHGFCAARITEARAVQLRARLGSAGPAPETKPARPRPAAQPAPAGNLY